MLISFSRINRIIGGISLLLLTACQHSSEECLSIAFTGDVLLDRGVRQQIQRGGVKDLFASVAPLFHQVDATVINLECPATSVHSPLHKKYIFCAEPGWMEELAKAGISHAALANNHTMDQGRSGLIDTYQHLLSAGITPIGYGNTSSESCQPVVIKKGKIKVALFNSVTLPLENWVYLENDPGICQQPIEEMEEEIKNFKQENPESYVVVILHWGMEYQSSPTLSQRKGARRLIRTGADAIIGHHPHVIQKEEYFKGKPIFYSLGNFVFDQRKPETSQSLIVQLNFTSIGYSIKLHPATINNCKPELQ